MNFSSLNKRGEGDLELPRIPRNGCDRPVHLIQRDSGMFHRALRPLVSSARLRIITPMFGHNSRGQVSVGAE
jgi:hypothetical protein